MLIQQVLCKHGCHARAGAPIGRIHKASEGLRSNQSNGHNGLLARSHSRQKTIDLLSKLPRIVSESWQKLKPHGLGQRWNNTYIDWRPLAALHHMVAIQYEVSAAMFSLWPSNAFVQLLAQTMYL